MIEDGETLDAASALDLARLTAGVTGLEAVVVFLRDPSHLYAHWLSSGGSLSASRVATAARPVLEASLDAADTLGAERDSRVGSLLELDAHLLFVEPLGRFGAAFVFASSAPLGLARLAVRRLSGALGAELEQVATAGRARPLDTPPTAKRSTSTPELAAAKTLLPTPNGERVRALLAELEAKALDPHLVRLRLALRSGLGREQLGSPDALPNEALRLIETLAVELFDETRGREAHAQGAAEP
jgi:hypothetical protein